MPNATVVTVSDRCFQGLRPDEGGPLVAEMLADAGYTVTETVLVPDEQPQIEAALIRLADGGNCPLQVTPRAMLSRAQAGIRGGSLIVNLPGSPKAARENLAAVLPTLAHGLEMLSGRPADCAKLTDRP